MNFRVIGKNHCRLFFLVCLLALTVQPAVTAAQALQPRVTNPTAFASNIFDAEVQIRGWENAGDQQERADLEFIYSHALGVIGGVAMAHPEWLPEIEPMIDNINHPIIRRAMILGVSVPDAPESDALLATWGDGEHGALVAELSDNGLAKIFVERPALSPAMAVIYVAAFGSTGEAFYVENIVNGYADALPTGARPNPVLADILENYIHLLAGEDRGAAEIKRLADTDFAGVGGELNELLN